MAVNVTRGNFPISCALCYGFERSLLVAGFRFFYALSMPPLECCRLGSYVFGKYFGDQIEIYFV